MTGSTGDDGVEVEDLIEFIKTNYRDEIMTLGQRYPKEQRSLHVEYSDLYRWNHEFAETYMSAPDRARELFEEAVRQFDLPVDIELSDANVRVHGLDDAHTYYPGEFSPTRLMNNRPFLAIKGQLEKVSDVRPQLVDAAFECQRCGTMTYIPQSETNYQEPHECQGCERQGPFSVNHHKSTFVDAQTLRVTEPPERAPDGNGTTIDIHVTEDLCDAAKAGDSVVVTGTLQFEQETQGGQGKNDFNQYVTGEAIEVSDSSYESLDITEGDRERARELSDEIFELAVDSIGVGLAGEPHPVVKEGIFLALIGGARVEFGDGTTMRGDLHILLVGDPSTGKSTYFEAIQSIAPRSTSASGKGATTAGLTGAAVRDDFGSTEWSIKGGALVRANKGVACIDELDKMDSESATSMNDALEKQQIPITKAGINTTLEAQTTVIAAANPRDTRWNDYATYAEQLDFDGALLSRFGLVFMLQDQPDEDRDVMVGNTIVGQKELEKARQAGDGDQWDDDVDAEPAIGHDFLQKYVAIAKRQPDPRFRPPEERKGSVEEFAGLVESYVSLRAANGYDDDQPVPISPRKLQDMHRVAEASARARLSEWIEEQDVQRAKRLVGASLQQYGQDEDGNFDADITETGTSKTQQDRKRTVYKLIDENMNEFDNAPGAPKDEIVSLASDAGIDERAVEKEIQTLMDQGEAYEPEGGHYRTT